MLAQLYTSFICIVGFCAASSTCQTTDNLKTLDAVLKNKNFYDSRIPPPTNDLVKVKVFLDIYNIWDLDQQSMDCKIDFQLELSWIDNRLDLKENVYAEITDMKHVRRFWTPKIIFPNSKRIEYHKDTSSNFHLEVGLYSGSVIEVFRASATFICNMQFHDFPFDSHRCFFQISTYSKNVSLKWDITSFEGKGIRENDIELPQFVLIDNTSTSFCDSSYQNDHIDCLQVNFYFRRRLGFHLINTYIPCFLIVVVSWGSFWMHPEAVPGRVSLGITTLLTMSGKSSAVLSSTAEVSYVKAIDIWMMMCMALVFLSLSEFVVANYRIRHRKHLKFKKSESNHVDVVANSTEIALTKKCIRRENWNIDRLSRIVFPVIFSIFNIVYWSYYLS